MLISLMAADPKYLQICHLSSPRTNSTSPRWMQLNYARRVGLVDRRENTEVITDLEQSVETCAVESDVVCSRVRGNLS